MDLVNTSKIEQKFIKHVVDYRSSPFLNELLFLNCFIGIPQRITSFIPGKYWARNFGLPYVDISAAGLNT